MPGTLPSRIYDTDGDHLSKNGHFRAMLQTAANRGSQSSFVLFDSWYSGIENLKFIDKLGWQWFFRVKKSRMVNPDNRENRPVASLNVPDDGAVVHMKKYGFVKLFHSVNKTGKDRYRAANCLTMDSTDRRNLQAICWSIENYHQALKELYCVEDCKPQGSRTTQPYQLLASRTHSVGGSPAPAEHYHLPGEMGDRQIGYHGVRLPPKKCALIFCANEMCNSYKERGAIGRFFSWIEAFKKTVPRYERYEHSFLGLIHLACASTTWRVMG